jgi:hypothetical protein
VQSVAAVTAQASFNGLKFGGELPGKTGAWR